MDLYETAFGLILNAGNSKSKSLMAIEEARDFNFVEAESFCRSREFGKGSKGRLEVSTSNSNRFDTR